MNFRGTEGTDPSRFGKNKMEVARERRVNSLGRPGGSLV